MESITDAPFILHWPPLPSTYPGSTPCQSLQIWQINLLKALLSPSHLIHFKNIYCLIMLYPVKFQILSLIFFPLHLLHYFSTLFKLFTPIPTSHMWLTPSSQPYTPVKQSSRSTSYYTCTLKTSLTTQAQDLFGSIFYFHIILVVSNHSASN